MRNVAWFGVAAVGLSVALAAFVLSGKPVPTPAPVAPPPPPRALEPPPPARPAASDVPPLTAGFIDDSGYESALPYTPPIHDRRSIAQVVEAYRQRVPRGEAEIRARLDALEATDPRPADFDRRRAMLQMFAGLLAMYDGRFAEAEATFDRAVRENPGFDPAFRLNVGAMRGIAALRRGEVENCVHCLGPSSCIFPIADEARHLQPGGSRAAIGYFAEYLEGRPDDLGVRWLWNVAAMTLGEYPDGVPAKFRIDPDPPGAGGGEIGRFENVAADAGLTARGPNMLGGSLFDDFDGDGLPDLVVTSGDWDRGAALYLNNGDGTFRDAGPSAGLDDQPLAVNASHADFDNDGRLDVLLLRGGWETPMRLSLLRNTGGAFEDVTVAAGLAEPIASQSAAWGDYDGDGDLDLFVCGEWHDNQADALNRCRLYRNNGDGTFADVAAEAGVVNEGWAKGAAWGDYDDDGLIDLYVSNMNGPNRLYRNLGDGTFADVAPGLGLDGPTRSFSCWFFDHDDDGRLDIFVAGFGAQMNDIIADRLGRPTEADRSRLYRNLGGGRFRDVAAEAGLDRVLLPMGSNFADVDNDGYLDIYLATGRPAYSILVPNVLYRNVGGRHFEDATNASGTGHLQKGHGVSFADLDEDGNLDLFVQVGGQTPGDRAYNLLFRNPGHGRRWLRAKLVGTTSNRAAIDAKIRVDVVAADGSRRSIHRVISGGSSFGGNALSAPIGLGDAAAVETLTVTWPGRGGSQAFRDLPLDRAVEITEGEPEFRVLPRRAGGDGPAD